MLNVILPLHTWLFSAEYHLNQFPFLLFQTVKCVVMSFFWFCDYVFVICILRSFSVLFHFSNSRKNIAFIYSLRTAVISSYTIISALALLLLIYTFLHKDCALLFSLNKNIDLRKKIKKNYIQIIIVEIIKIFYINLSYDKFIKINLSIIKILIIKRV